MKVAHWAAVVVLILMSLMNLGAATGDSSTAVKVIGVVIGVAGLTSVYGLIRHTSWGPLAALATAGAFLVTSVIGLIEGWDGSPIGVGVSVVGLILIAIGESAALRNRGVVTAR
jgi:hypothetical protein